MPEELTPAQRLLIARDPRYAAALDAIRAGPRSTSHGPLPGELARLAALRARFTRCRHREPCGCDIARCYLDPAAVRFVAPADCAACPLLPG
jgi:hypothetical protein